ncbi:tetratricopeptide repeat protein [Leeuwenhoekiella marinoflava]|uniref:Tetratricopeptide repeat protein n=2 Tax=Leeuwenhoekiella marinoflava TaxID=988 RepID=A0A4Q0PJY8_9FLAO|nr:tetratricopeptide repeat protein [Leeuwenhoekiella marinoflava]RXG27912.1 tetratricopeptide repeat protein [Leeuwenhoekiella marinoflava]SHF61570.1 Tetratricopeptide repeat-containing protein [Leeuwenhoekiella marinoflava DSM 3653]
MHLRILFFLFFSATIFAQKIDFQKAEGYFKTENFNKAKPIFLAHLKQHPNDAKTREYLGDIASYEENWDDAIAYYEELLEENPSSANFNFKYGGAMGMKALNISKLRALTYIDDIKKHFIRAAELDPKHIETRWALVELYLQLPGIIGGSEKKAEAYAMELQNISPVDGYLARGYVAEYKKDMKDAEVLYKKAIEVGGSPTTYEKLINLYEKKNEPKKALNTAASSLKLHKRNQINYQIGKIAAEFNIEHDLGLASLKHYIANYSAKDGVPVSWAHYRMAQIYKNRGDKTRAIHYINLALADKPDFEQALEEKERISKL